MAERELEVLDIQIEDPMDFLNASEKEAYIRAHQDTLMRSEDEMRRIREQTEPVETGAPRGRGQTAYAFSGDDGDDDDDDPYGKPVRESAAEWIVSVAVRAMFAAILIVGLIMVYMLFLRPVVQRAMGRTKWFSAADRAEDVDEEMAKHIGGNTQASEDAGEPAEQSGETVVTTTDLRLRTAPNTETSEVITTVPTGTKLSRIAESDGWSTVLYEGQELYCASEYLRKE